MQSFSLEKGLEILERTPAVLQSLLAGLSDSWIKQNEGGDSWSPFDNVGHLIHGEKTDWVVRSKIILEYGETKPFEPFDRFAQEKISKGKTMKQLLDEFSKLRRQNLEELRRLNVTESNLKKTGIHPEFGRVTLKQLLATWVAHDLGHIRQITRVMAKQYKEDIGPWQEYLSVVGE